MNSYSAGATGSQEVPKPPSAFLSEAGCERDQGTAKADPFPALLKICEVQSRWRSCMQPGSRRSFNGVVSFCGIFSCARGSFQRPIWFTEQLSNSGILMLAEPSVPENEMPLLEVQSAGGGQEPCLMSPAGFRGLDRQAIRRTICCSCGGVE